MIKKILFLTVFLMMRQDLQAAKHKKRLLARIVHSIFVVSVPRSFQVRSSNALLIETAVNNMLLNDRLDHENASAVPHNFGEVKSPLLTESLSASFRVVRPLGLAPVRLDAFEKSLSSAHSVV